MLHEGMVPEIYVTLERAPHIVQRVCVYRDPVTDCLHVEIVPFSHQGTLESASLDDFRNIAREEYKELIPEIEQLFDEAYSLSSEMGQEIGEFLRVQEEGREVFAFSFLGFRVSVRKQT